MYEATFNLQLHKCNQIGNNTQFTLFFVQHILQFSHWIIQNGNKFTGNI